MTHSSESSHALCDLLLQAALTHLDQAVSLLSTSGPIPPAEVHETRKAVKRVRAAMCLIRGELGPRFADWNGRLRTVNRRLSSTRDLDVCGTTIHELPASRSPAEQDVLDRLQAELAVQRAAAADEVANHQRESLVEDLRTVRQGVLDWKCETPDFGLIRPAVRDMVKRARKRIKRLDEKSPSEDIHALRKIVKLRLYWLEFLQPIWPRGWEGERKRVDSLSDSLGKHHDLAVLDSSLRQSAVGRDSSADRQVQGVMRRIRHQQRKLAAQGLKLAQRLFAERPREFAQRWKTLVDLWQMSTEPDEQTPLRIRPR